MKSFTYFNPVRIVFGKGKIANLDKLVPEKASILIVIGGGSVKKNGILEQVTTALKNRRWKEFSGIEANPDFDTCMRAVQTIRENALDFILAVGGGSVLDAAKFIAAAACLEKEDPWDILLGKVKIQRALPLGTVLTLAATGSEMNSGAVISRRSLGAKLPFAAEAVFPVFSILDPETTFSVSPHMSACGVADAWVHVTEQYLSHDLHAPLQDRQSEGILLTLLESGPKILSEPKDYNARADVMWCATQALNGLTGCGVPQDWASHMIGHELTAAFGLAHGETLAMVLPALLRVRREKKEKKILQYGKRIFGIDDTGDPVEKTIRATENFFRELGIGTRLEDYGIPLDKALKIADQLEARKVAFGEDGAVDGAMIRNIFRKAQRG